MLNLNIKDATLFIYKKILYNIKRNNVKVSQIEENNIIIEAELFSLDGSKRFHEKKTGKIEEFREIGKEIGQILKTKSNNSYKR